VLSSASGGADQIPRIPNSSGRITMPTERKTKLRSTEISADSTPLDKAVKSDEENILKPQKKNAAGTM